MGCIFFLNIIIKFYPKLNLMCREVLSTPEVHKTGKAVRFIHTFKVVVGEPQTTY